MLGGIVEVLSESGLVQHASATILMSVGEGSGGKGMPEFVTTGATNTDSWGY